MKTLKNLSACLLFSFSVFNASGQSIEAKSDPRLDWFKEAKLGIFLHWGIYAVNGIPESWSFYNGEISYQDYMNQSKSFTAKNYNPADWAKLFKEAGARYAVLTAKHHDGFALWDTKLSRLNAKDMSPAKRDLIGPYCTAMRMQD